MTDAIGSQIADSVEERFYRLDDEEKTFFKAQTGIEDDEELKKHILDVAAEAYAIYRYGCIRILSFTRLTVSSTDAYHSVLKLKNERPSALFLDLGCCFGNDTRKIVADGWPISQCIASDLRPEFWSLGHKLFKTTPESFPAKFIAGNVLDPDHLTVEHYGSYIESVVSRPPPDVQDLQSLNSLKGRVSAIHCSNVFHLFDEPDQSHLARALASLLYPFPGSIIFGVHLTKREKGDYPILTKYTFRKFCHSIESWKDMWEETFGPEKGVVKVEARLVEIDSKVVKEVWGDEVGEMYRMNWSVCIL